LASRRGLMLESMERIGGVAWRGYYLTRHRLTKTRVRRSDGLDPPCSPFHMQPPPPRLLLSRFLSTFEGTQLAPYHTSTSYYCRRQVKTALYLFARVIPKHRNQQRSSSQVVQLHSYRWGGLAWPRLRASARRLAVTKTSSMGRLKSNSGCRTCLARKKKCDEASPQCANCKRLGIVCVRRTDLVKGTSAIITPTNLRGKMQGLALPITNGYQPFASDLEKTVSLGSSQVFDPLVSCMAGAEFASVDLLVNFCAKDLLVREAIMAFSAFTKAPSVIDPHKQALKSYQGCIIRLKKTRLDSQADPAQTCFVLTAVCFLGLLEVSITNPIAPAATNRVEESWVW
jgi:hypothetical protein